MPVFALTMLLQAALPNAPMITPATLQAAVELFAGRPALVDPRLLLPACARPDMAFDSGRRSVVVHCAAPEWRVFVPLRSDVALAALPPPVVDRAAPAIRRGDRVTVEAEGPGFVVGMEAVAEQDSRDGRVVVHPTGGGRRIVAQLGEDGRVRIRPLNAVVNSR